MLYVVGIGLFLGYLRHSFPNFSSRGLGRSWTYPGQLTLSFAVRGPGDSVASHSVFAASG